MSQENVEIDSGTDDNHDGNTDSGERA